MEMNKRLRVLDPHNIHDIQTPWSEVVDLFGYKVVQQANADMQERAMEANRCLDTEWSYYLRLERCSVDSHRNLASLWKASGDLVYTHVAPFLFFFHLCCCG